MEECKSSLQKIIIMIKFNYGKGNILRGYWMKIIRAIIALLIVIFIISSCSMDYYYYDDDYYDYYEDKLMEVMWIDSLRFLTTQNYDGYSWGNTFACLVNTQNNYKERIEMNVGADVNSMLLVDSTVYMDCDRTILTLDLDNRKVLSFDKTGNSGLISPDFRYLMYTEDSVLYLHNMISSHDSIISENVVNVIYVDWANHVSIGYYDSTIIQIFPDGSTELLADLGNDIYDDISLSCERFSYNVSPAGSNIINIRIGSSGTDNPCLAVDVSDSIYELMGLVDAYNYTQNSKREYIIRDWNQIEIYNKNDSIIHKYKYSQGLLYEADD